MCGNGEMAEHNSSNSDSDAEESSHNSSAETLCPNNAPSAGLSHYEKQRLSRIAENRARMEALGLNNFTSSLMASSQKAIKHKGKDADEDYRPNANHEDDDDDDDDDDFVGGERSGSRRWKVKNKGSKSKAKLDENSSRTSDYIDEDDALQQAIALSLKESAEVSNCSDSNAKDGTFNDNKRNSHVQEDTGKRKKKKTLFTRRVQMNEDELVVHFCQFDEQGKGSITARDLLKIAAAHDFHWTDKEISDMIYCFDSNNDGKLSFEDFQKIVGRCNMIQGPSNPEVF